MSDRIAIEEMIRGIHARFGHISRQWNAAIKTLQEIGAATVSAHEILIEQNMQLVAMANDIGRVVDELYVRHEVTREWPPPPEDPSERK